MYIYLFNMNFQLPLPGGDTTEHQLTLAIWATVGKKLEFKPLPGFDPNLDNLQYYRAQQEIDCDEVYPGIYIGDG